MEIDARGMFETRAGRSPPSVLGGIQLSSLPWSRAGASTTTFGLALHGSAVSSQLRRTQDLSITAYGGPGFVSVPSPTVSGCASQHHASCNEGGTSPGISRRPLTGSRRGRNYCSPFSLFTGWGRIVIRGSVPRPLIVPRCTLQEDHGSG